MLGPTGGAGFSTAPDQASTSIGGLATAGCAMAPSAEDDTRDPKAGLGRSPTQQAQVNQFRILIFGTDTGVDVNPRESNEVR